jgi:hypothetical protein
MRAQLAAGAVTVEEKQVQDFPGRRSGRKAGIYTITIFAVII